MWIWIFGKLYSFLSWNFPICYTEKPFFIRLISNIISYIGSILCIYFVLHFFSSISFLTTTIVSSLNFLFSLSLYPLIKSLLQWSIFSSWYLRPLHSCTVLACIFSPALLHFFVILLTLASFSPALVMCKYIVA